MKIKRIIVASLAAVMLLSGASAAFAQTTTPTTTLTAQQQAVQSLMQQIQQLQSQIQALKGQRQDAVTTLVNTLKEGSSGDAVSILQAILAADPSVFPEGKITGFFGGLTKKAVMNFQKKNDLPQVGHVGPMTLGKLNQWLKNNPVSLENSTSTSSYGKRLCAMVPPGHMIAAGWLRKNDGQRPIVPACQTLPQGILNQLNSTSTTPRPTSTADVIAPILSRIRTSVATTSVVVTWKTNEAATSQVLYGTSTAMGASSTLDASLVTNHSQTVTGLTADTTYYFKVLSKDAAGNLRTSAQGSFETEN